MAQSNPLVLVTDELATDILLFEAALKSGFFGEPVVERSADDGTY